MILCANGRTASKFKKAMVLCGLVRMTNLAVPAAVAVEGDYLKHGAGRHCLVHDRAKESCETTCDPVNGRASGWRRQAVKPLHPYGA